MKSFRLVALSAMLTIGTFSTFVYTSCTKDECKGVTCNNGGTCSGGTCACPGGVGGANCETIFRDGYKNTYKGIGTASDTTTYTDWRLAFTNPSGTDYTKMNVTLQDATGTGQLPVMDITLSNFPSTTVSGSTTYNIVPLTTTTRFTYSGYGTISGTTASLILSEKDSSGHIVVFTFNNMIKI